MKKPDPNRRRAFLRKLTFTLAAVGTFSFFKFQASKSNPEIKLNTISKPEADDLIKANRFSDAERIKPSPAPQKKVG